MKNEIPPFSANVIWLNHDQPTTCPYCGTRTDFYQISEKQQFNICLNTACGFKFLSENDDEYYF
jgi:hypothetical protein